MKALRSFFKLRSLLITAFLCCISYMVYAQYAVNYDGTTYKIDPRFWRSNRTEILVELGTNAGGGTILVTNYVRTTNYVYTTNTVLVTNNVFTYQTNFVYTTNSVLTTNYVYTTNTVMVTNNVFTYQTNFVNTTNYVNVTNNPAANVALLDATYQEFTGASNKFTGKLYAPQAVLGDITATSVTVVDPFSVNAGGTGARSPEGAQTNLNLVPGTHIQAQNTRLQQIADLNLTNVTILVHSNALTQFAVTPAGLALLKAADAAALRTLLNAAEIDNTAYGAGWNGVTTKSPSQDAVYDAIASLTSVTNLITGVNTNYFAITNGVLTWIGSTNGGGGITAFSQVSELSGVTPVKYDHWQYDGSGWKPSSYDQFESSDEWEYMEWTFTGKDTAFLLQPGMGTIAITGGNCGQTNYFNGDAAVFLRTAANDTVGTGYALFTDTGGCLWTNVNKVRFRGYIPTSNASFGFLGWGNSTTLSGEHTSALGFTITNLVVCPIASTNSSKVVGNTYTIQPAVDYDFYIRHTNTTARFQIVSNNVVVFDNSITTGIPIQLSSSAMYLMVAYKNNSTALTNTGTLIVLDNIKRAKKMR